MLWSLATDQRLVPEQAFLFLSPQACGAPSGFIWPLLCNVTLKEKKRQAVILFLHKTILFKYPFYYIICIVILIIDLADSSNEAGEYKVSNKVNCCL